MGGEIGCNSMPLPQQLLTYYIAFQYNICICKKKKKSGLSKNTVSKMLSLNEENQIFLPIHIGKFPSS